MRKTRSKGPASPSPKKVVKDEYRSTSESDDDEDPEPLATQRPEFSRDDVDDDAPSSVAPRLTTPENLQHLGDLMDYWTERILLEPEQSPQHIKHLKELYELYSHSIGQHFDYGRYYTRKLMAELVESLYKDKNSLETWARDDWEDFLDDLLMTSTAVQRMDATNVCESLVDGEVFLESNTTLNPTTTSNSKIDKRLNVVQTLITAHISLAPIRADLDLILETGKVPKCDQKALKDVYEYIQDNMRNEYCKEHIGIMVTRNIFNNRKTTFELAELPVLTESFLENRYFTYETFRTKVLHLINTWDKAVFGSESCILISKNYRYEAPVQVKRKNEHARMEHLREGRKRLKYNGDDPLDEALEKSEGARVPEDDDDEEELKDANQVVSTPQKQQSATKNKQKKPDLSDDDDDDEESSKEGDTGGGQGQDENEQQGSSNRIELQSPQSLRKNVASMLCKQTAKADEGIFDANGKVLKRRRWTEQEDNALKLGVKEEGVGNWKEIKALFPEILHNRTTVQLKDRFRVLYRNRQGEMENDAV